MAAEFALGVKIIEYTILYCPTFGYNRILIRADAAVDFPVLVFMARYKDDMAVIIGIEALFLWCGNQFGE